MQLTDSRRLTGPNLLQEAPGAVIEVVGSGSELDRAVAAWQQECRALLDDLGWSRERLTVRRYRGGASLAFSAPIDALYAACEVNEAAWQAACASCGVGDPADPELVRAKLRHEIDSCSNPGLLQLAEAARRSRVAFLSDDDLVSVGAGTGALSWPVSRPPDPAAVDWGRVHDVPLALVTGTNGKTTTVRMLAAMAHAAGVVAANTSTDGVQLDGEFIARGDYTGGEGARLLLRDRRVEVAVLETARGGMLRRGLPVATADVALVTNIGTDHLGEYGIDDLEQLAAVKLIVARAIRTGGSLIANADDPVLAPAARALGVRTEWVSARPDSQAIERRPGVGWLCRDGELGREDNGSFDAWLRIDQIPVTLSGAALHNVYNALGAMAVGAALGLAPEPICEGLRTFTSDSSTNPGRGNLYELGGVTAYADFAHNPEGISTVLEIGSALPAERRLVILGQAGDRTDDSIDAIARAAAACDPDLIILKQMDEYLRGRQPGEVVARLQRELAASGFPEERVEIAASEMAAVRRALEWSLPGDLLFLLLHAEREAALELLDALDAAGWQPREPLPPAGGD